MNNKYLIVSISQDKYIGMKIETDEKSGEFVNHGQYIIIPTGEQEVEYVKAAIYQNYPYDEGR